MTTRSDRDIGPGCVQRRPILAPRRRLARHPPRYLDPSSEVYQHVGPLEIEVKWRLAQALLGYCPLQLTLVRVGTIEQKEPSATGGYQLAAERPAVAGDLVPSIDARVGDLGRPVFLVLPVHVQQFPNRSRSLAASTSPDLQAQ